MTEKHWWTNYPWRMIQTNLREIDMAEIDAETYAQQLADYGATVVTLNAAGIIASYQTKLEFQTQSPYLTGSSLREILDACHKRGIRVIARMDFSKLREDVFARHPDWAYRDKDGNIVNYNGNIQTCPNGGYQQTWVNISHQDRHIGILYFFFQFFFIEKIHVAELCIGKHPAQIMHILFVIPHRGNNFFDFGHTLSSPLP
jgi:hypothetical protein